MGLTTFLSGWFGGKATQIESGGQVKIPNTFVSSPKDVNEDTALQLSVVYRCIAVTAQMLGATPMCVHEETKGKRQRVNNDLWDLIQNQPNPYMSGQEFRETLAMNLLLHGNFYAQIHRNTLGQPVSLTVMPSQNTTPELRSGELKYIETVYRDEHDIRQIEHDYDAVFHIKGMGNGLAGLSPLAYQRQTIGIGVAQDEFTGNFYSSGGKPGGVLYTENGGILTKEQREQLRTNIASQLSGSKSSHSTLLLEGGYKYQQTQLTPQDLATLEGRKYQTEEIARIFGVPLALLGMAEHAKSKVDSIEDVLRAWLSTDLGAYFTKIETECKRKLMTRSERSKYDIKFDANQIMKYDIKTLFDVAEKGIRNGFITQNEGRELVGQARIEKPEYDVLRQQAQMVSQESTTKTQEDSNGN